MQNPYLPDGCTAADVDRGYRRGVGNAPIPTCAICEQDVPWDSPFYRFKDKRVQVCLNCETACVCHDCGELSEEELIDGKCRICREGE